MIPLTDPATSAFLAWAVAYNEYARRARSTPHPLRDLRRLHHHHLTVAEAYVVLHRQELLR